MRVVLDTNILVSALIAPAGNPAAIYKDWEQGKFTLLTCAEHLDELRATLQKPRVAELIKPYKAGRLVNPIMRLAEDIGQLPQVRRSPDPADNFLLALAEAATRITSSPATKAACWRSPVTSPLASSPRATSPPCSQNRTHESRFSSSCDSRHSLVPSEAERPLLSFLSQSFGGHLCAPWMTFAISTMSLRIRYTTTKGSGGKGSSRVPSTRPVLPLFGKDFNEPALS